MEMKQARVRELFDYREDGALIWKVSASQMRPGDVAGCLSKRNGGYVVVRFDGVLRLAHRIIFLWHHGYLPVQVDHRDHDRSNNRIGNLRAADNGNNMRNRGAQANNTSGYKGVSLHKPTGRWVAMISYGGKQRYLGLYDTPEDAALIYAINAFRHHGEFARLTD